ncbi:YciI family protein [Kribbella sp. NPDC056951]|uniref:YciI family protein n=1 Tax=Kribbella sp. NPDC056951 TaxID=3345978 RepID=UPI0036445F2D
MRFLLIVHGETRADLRRSVFEQAAREAGELVGGELLAHQQLTVTVPDRAGPEDIDAYYVIDVESPARAVELARLLPDACLEGRYVEIRAIMRPAGEL